MTDNKYVIFGVIPVRREDTPSGGMKILKLNMSTLSFEYGYDYHLRMSYDTSGDVEYVTRDQFIEHVETLRALRYKKDDELGVIYKQQTAIEDKARTEKRALTDEEKAQLTALRHQTYALFAEKYPEP